MTNSIVCHVLYVLIGLTAASIGVVTASVAEALTGPEQVAVAPDPPSIPDHETGAPARVEVSFNPAIDIGNTQTSVECAHLYIQNPNLTEGIRVQVVKIEYEPARVVQAEVIRLTACAENMKGEWAKLTPNERSAPVYKYQIRFTGEELRPVGYGIGVVNTNADVNVSGTTAWADLDGDGISEYFRDCDGKRAAYTSVWTGRPLKGTRIWRALHHFKGDLLETCKKADY